jgi:hypothetical protein
MPVEGFSNIEISRSTQVLTSVPQMHALVRVTAVLLVLVASAAAHSHHIRQLMQASNKKPPVVAKNSTSGFSPGTALDFLNKLDEGKVDKLLGAAKAKDNRALARKLEADPDMVRMLAPAHARCSKAA